MTIHSVIIGSGIYRFTAETLDRLMHEHRDHDLLTLQRNINERVTGSPDGCDDGCFTYHCTETTRFGCLAILADMETDID